MLKQLKKIVVSIFAIFGALYLALNIYAVKTVSCSMIKLASTQSPDAKYVAEIQSQTCENSKDSGIFLRIAPTDSSNSSNTLILPNTTTDVGLHWQSPNNLRVLYPADISINDNAAYQLKGVQIEYRKG